MRAARRLSPLHKDSQVVDKLRWRWPCSLDPFEIVQGEVEHVLSVVEHADGDEVPTEFKECSAQGMGIVT